MTHFAVLVICPNTVTNSKDARSYIEEALAKYDENKNVPYYISDYYSKRAEMRERKIVETRGYLSTGHTDALRIRIAEMEAMTPEEYFEKEVAYDGPRDSDRNLLSCYNPDARWDWYEIGGRWSGYYTQKDGKDGDVFQLKQFDAEAYHNMSIENRKIIWNDTMSKPEDMRKHYADIMGVDLEKGLDAYLNVPFVKFPTSCAVVRNGVWFENGKMDWWGISHSHQEPEDEWDSRFYDRFIEGLSPETFLVLVDCHI